MYILQFGGDKTLLIVSDTLPILCSLIASVCLFIAFKGLKEFDFAKKAWLFILLGIILYFIAESTYALLEIVWQKDMNESFPTFADFFWCAGYFPLFIGLALMFKGYRKSGFPMGNIKHMIMLSAALVIVLLLVIIFVLVPIIQDEETGLLSKIFSMFYPVADILVVIPATILMYITSLFGKGIISWPWRFLALGFISFTIADLLYSYLSWQDLYGSGNLIDIFWHLGYLLIGMAGLYQRELIDSFKTRA
jgi:hypothetical protein